MARKLLCLRRPPPTGRRRRNFSGLSQKRKIPHDHAQKPAPESPVLYGQHQNPAPHLGRLLHQLLRVVQPCAADGLHSRRPRPDRPGGQDTSHPQRRAHDPGTDRRRHARRSLRAADHVFAAVGDLRRPVLPVRHRRRFPDHGHHPLPARFRRCRLRHRDPHDRRMVPRQAGGHRRGHLWWLGQFRLGRGSHEPANHRPGVRRRRRLALCAGAHRCHRPRLFGPLLPGRLEKPSGCTTTAIRP